MRWVPASKVESGRFHTDQNPTSDDVYNLRIANFAATKMAKDAPSSIKTDMRLLAQTLADAKANPEYSRANEIQVLEAKSRVEAYIRSNCHSRDASLLVSAL